MAYKESSIARYFLDKINKYGKDDCLVPYTYEPPLQKFMDKSALVLLVLATPAGILFRSWTVFFIFTGLCMLIFSLRELFVQDDKTLIRIYGPFGRVRYLFEDTFRDKYLQYFNETNTDGRPIPRIVRDYIYQKAKNIKPLAGFRSGEYCDVSFVAQEFSGRELRGRL